ncbi:hypothetical protein [Micromonospora sp. NPDC049497]|uniref:hypothetical protein n=1 Tax=Micromonospora sp. NPDC049497 TaxID=3364273 RepID=UPI0037A0E290
MDLTIFEKAEMKLANGVLYLLELAGIVLAAYAVVVVWLKGQPPRSGRWWGAARQLSRRSFAALFGTLGLSFSLVMHLILFHRDQQIWLAVGVLTVVVLLLVLNWIRLARSHPDRIG